MTRKHFQFSYVLFGTCISRDNPRNGFTGLHSNSPRKIFKVSPLAGEVPANLQWIRFTAFATCLYHRGMFCDAADLLVSSRKRTELPSRFQVPAFRVLLHCGRHVYLRTADNRNKQNSPVFVHAPSLFPTLFGSSQQVVPLGWITVKTLADTNSALDIT